MKSRPFATAAIVAALTGSWSALVLYTDFSLFSSLLFLAPGIPLSRWLLPPHKGVFHSLGEAVFVLSLQNAVDAWYCATAFWLLFLPAATFLAVRYLGRKHA
jgi:hypothetical protein